MYNLGCYILGSDGLKFFTIVHVKVEFPTAEEFSEILLAAILAFPFCETLKENELGILFQKDLSSNLLLDYCSFRIISALT